MNTERLYLRLWRLGYSDSQIRFMCADAAAQIRAGGRFVLQVGPGYLFGYMSNHGIEIGA